MPLDQLEEHGRPVRHRLGEDLQQVAVLVPVRQDAELASLVVIASCLAFVPLSGGLPLSGLPQALSKRSFASSGGRGRGGLSRSPVVLAGDAAVRTEPHPNGLHDLDQPAGASGSVT